MLGFDTFPIAHTIPALVLCGSLLLWQSWRPQHLQRLFLPATFILLFFLRLPSIWFNNEINPDESQMITQAMTLAQDPVYFRSVDGTTGGPLDSYFLIIPHWFGLPFDFITAHLFAYGLIVFFLWLTFRTARLWFGAQAAQLALLPLVFLLGLTQNGDFLHYNSELVAIVLLAGAAYLFAKQTATASTGPSLFLLGLLLGMVPFGKLQGVPLAAVIGLFAVLNVARLPSLSFAGKAKQALALLLGGLTFPLLFMLFMKLGGQFDDFVTFYIEGNFNYATGGNQWNNLLQLPRFFQKGTEFAWYVLLAISLGILGMATTLLLTNRVNSNQFRLFFLFAWVAATLYAITRTGSEYVHYLFFLMGPLFLLMALSWSIILNAPKWIYRVGLILAALFLVNFGIQVFNRYRTHVAINPYPSDGQGGWRLPQSEVIRQVRNYAKPGEKLAVWGWRCDYYVQAQMPQAVAENHTIRSTFIHPMRSVYQRRYIQDFTRSFPPVFIDAVGSQNLWMDDRKTQGYEIIRPLRGFVAAHYRYMGLYNDARLYVRYDRVANEQPKYTTILESAGGYAPAQ